MKPSLQQGGCVHRADEHRHEHAVVIERGAVHQLADEAGRAEADSQLHEFRHRGTVA